MKFSTKLKLAINNPRLLARKLNQFSTWIPIYDYTKNKSVFQKDWDNLILLDSLNYDIAKEYNWEAHSVSAHRSRATNSKEFFINEVSNKDLTDTVYISANAWIEELYDKHEFELHKLISLDVDMPNDPKIVAKRAKQIAQNHKRKRIVIHFMQPHFPVLSNDYDDINEEWYKSVNNRPMNLWQNKMIDNIDKNISREKLIDAYESNIKHVLPIVKDLVNDVQGKTVVSADHGQLFGERVRPVPIKMWGHPQGAYADRLLEVPWIVYCSDNRRSVIAGGNKGMYDNADRNVREELENLGYIN